MKVNYRELRAEDFSRLDLMNSQEELEHIYVFKSGQLSLRKGQPRLSSWSREDLYNIKNILDKNQEMGLNYGAFNREDLIGFLSLDLDTNMDFASLDSIYIDKNFKSMGIGTNLMKKAIKEARLRNKTSLAILAPAQEKTINFFLGLDARPSKKPLLKKEGFIELLLDL